MLTTHEKSTDVVVLTEDRVALRGRMWKSSAPRAMLIVAHGFGEHGGSYRHVAEELAGTHAIDVLAVDFRGHGRSPGRRGVIRRYDLFVDDLRDIVRWAARQNPGLPLFALGHSNGGQVALRLLVEGCRQIKGLVVSNPAIRIGLEIPRSKILLGKLLKAFAPWITLSSGSPSTDLTSDPRMRITFQNDPLRHNRINPPFYFGMVEGEKYLMSRAAKITLPILMLLGSQDPVIDPNTSREFFEKVASADKTLLIYPGMLHEPLNEVGREQVIGDLVGWIERQVDGE
ncbi:MAG: lysophospholipase [Planctomycetes bacterium SCN 63-9]|nr:MAG: lysophospholipase [Planctomycetes bacterium SCN 63-9]